MWTIDDSNKGWCAPSDVGKEKIDHERWTLAELEAKGLPGYLLNTVKPPSAFITDPAPPLTFDIEEVPARKLKRDVLAAYAALGGVEYLISMGQKDPANFNKLLAKILPQAIEADVRYELANKDLTLIPTHELKAMVLQALAKVEGQTVEGEVVR